MTVSVAVVCEAPADLRTIAALAERLICETFSWIEPGAVGDHVAWRGFRAADTHLEWTALDRLADDLNLVVRFRDVGPRHPYSATARRALLVLARAPEPVDAVVLVPDSDNDPDRRKGLEQARDYTHAPFPVVVGLTHTKRECWHICGFEPADAAEEAAVARLTAELGPDFRRKTEALTAKHDPANDKRSAKRVLGELTGGNSDREARCLTGLSLVELAGRGRNNGLADFLEDVKARLLPLFGHVPPAPA